MNVYEFFIAINNDRSHVAKVRINAGNSLEAEQLAYMQYGRENVITYRTISES